MKTQKCSIHITALLFTAVLQLFTIACQSPMHIRAKRTDQGMHMKPLIVGHRGASGHTPEHTLHAYEMAIEMGADIFEPDLVSTKDGVLIARHENNIADTTNVAQMFPDRKATKVIDGKKMEGYFTEDFTWAELKKLRAVERLPFRNQMENGKYPIATFEEVLKLREQLSKVYGVAVGIAPELKHSTYFRSIGLPLEEKFIELVKKFKMDATGAPIMVQSFEVANLKQLRKDLPNIQIVQLLDEEDMSPYDAVMTAKGSTPLKYKDMATQKGLKEIATYANWVSPWKPYIIPYLQPKDKSPKSLQNLTLKKPTDFVKNAHAAGLKVVPYTFRNEDQYLSKEDKGRPEGEYLRFFELGVDAVFSDFPDTAVWARNYFLKSGNKNE